ncbi:MAG TPA: hypothetical protein VKE98_10490 [Gemmataceae bacterium]|nr:hypothetical protein [Gemmataceae bacterium]
MDAGYREELIFAGGSLVLTDSHLLLVNPKGVVTASFDLVQTGNIRPEEHHSFRHRGLGMIAAAVLLVPSLWSLISVMVSCNWPILGTHLGVAIFFGLLFGMLFLYGVLASRRIPWLRLTYNGREKLIPLPGIEKHEVKKILDLGTRIPR